MSADSLQMMTGVLTAPYRRGAETVTLTLGGAQDGWTAVEPYDFAEYEARYRAAPPAPRYVLFARNETGADGRDFEVEYLYGGVAAVARVSVPAGTAAGASFVIPTPLGAGATLRLSRVRLRPAAAGEVAGDDWQVVALLGNTSKLAWVLAWEKNQIRRGLETVAGQRHLAAARGRSLDRIGEGLHVPRFPARPYSFDPQTIALYHFDDTGGNSANDAMVLFGRPGSQGTAHGTIERVPGKFGKGIRFPAQVGASYVRLPPHAHFNVGAGQSFTVEAFVKVEGVQDLSGRPRVVAMKSASDDEQRPTGAGWVLSVGGFRGIASNFGWTLTDDTGARVEVFADLNLADRRFHHLACVLDRDAGKARLFVDGEERASAPAAQLGAVSNGEEVFIGGTESGGVGGVIDEVRFSGVARLDFHPALGEGDEQYRQCLAVFSRLMVPSPPALAEAVNRLVKIGGVSPSFVVAESDRAATLAHREIKVLPRELRRGASIASDGDTRTDEASAAGTPADEPEFDAAWLISHDDPRAEYDPQPNARRMQRGTARALDRLLERLTGVSWLTGKLRVRGAFDPAATDLRRVGRSLLISHPGLRPGQLAVHAHAAGFDYVSHERGGLVRVAVRKSEPLAIMLKREPQPAAWPVLSEGATYALTLVPAPPKQARVRWTVVRGGAGDGEIEAGDEATTFRAHAAGVVLLRAEVTLNRQTVRASRYLRISVATLAPGASVGGDGRRGVSEQEAAGAKSDDFDERFLLSRTDALADYGSNPQNRRMQLGLSRALDRLLVVLPEGGTLRVRRAFVPGAADLHGEGRALLLRHSTLAPGELAPLAFAAGFDFIRHEEDGESLHVSVMRSELFAVNAPAELEVDATAELSLEPLKLGGGADESVVWSAFPFPRGRVEVPTEGEIESAGGRVTVTGREPGTAVVRAMHLRGGKTDPYQFSLRLAPELDHEGTYIAKDQYDVIINLLNRLRPVGVKVLTDEIRTHVAEVREGLADAFPGYAYPKF